MSYRKLIFVLLIAGSFQFSFAQAAKQKKAAPQPKAQKQSIDLPSSKALMEPVPGQPQKLNSFPANLAVSPDGRYVAILNAGYGMVSSKSGQSIAIVDRQQNTVTDYADPRVGRQSKQVYFYGIAFSGDGKRVYASLESITDPLGADKGNTGNGIAVYTFNDGKLEPERFIPITMRHLDGKRLATAIQTAQTPRKIGADMAPAAPAGIAVIASNLGERLLVANNFSDDAVLLDANSGKELQRFDLSTGREIPAEYPLAVVASKDGAHAWISLWNGSAVAELDLAAGKVTRQISLRPPKAPTEPGSHPSSLLLSPDESKLYVALANRDAVAVVDLRSGNPTYLSTQLPGQQYVGVFPIGLAQSQDGKRLYVADASADAVAVFDPSKPKPLGFIPTEWYPTTLAVIGDELVIVTGKGQGSGPNSQRVDDTGSGFSARPGHPYILGMVGGSVARLKTAEAEGQLAQLTREVLDSNRMSGRLPELPFKAGRNPIKHVIYMIKENRTYDQVFGDIKEANGDASLVMYGEDISPNHHKLARQFGVLDNFYDSGEVSGDGHVWSTAAIASDYTERNIQVNYRGKERTYDFEGSNVGDVPLEKGIPDINEPSTGYIWGNVARHGLTLRNYAEYVDMEFCDTPNLVSPHQNFEMAVSCPKKFVAQGEPLPEGLGNPPGGSSPYPWHVPMIAYHAPTKPEITGHYDPKFATFNTSYPDQLRADEFLREFDGFVKARQSGKGEQLPNFIVMKLPNDHTGGTRPGVPSPQANVADNDLALGRIVEAVSHSPYWDDTAILVLEDDAQNGADHVDAHRSIALVISKYSPTGTADKPFVDHHFYTTVNMIHTAEALLGLPPMNHNDARAAIMSPLFSGPGTQPPYTVDKRNLENGLIYKVNPENAPGARQSSKMDFSHPDAAPADELNAILWRQAKGNAPMPEPKHSVIPADEKE